MTSERREDEGTRTTQDDDTEGHAARRQLRDTEAASLNREGTGGDEDQDAEGHMFLSDTNAAREIARARNAEAERAARERRLQKEARPNRQGG